MTNRDGEILIIGRVAKKINKGGNSVLLAAVAVVLAASAIILVMGGGYGPTRVLGASTVKNWWQVIVDKFRPEWQTYHNSQYGYSLKYPRGWKVRDASSDSQREIWVTANDKSALVRINAYHDLSMKDLTGVKRNQAAMKDKLYSDKDLKVKAFKEMIEGEIGGTIAQGEQQIDGAAWQFENRGLFATNDRIMIMHGAAKLPGSPQVWKNIYRIMESFALDKN